MPNKLLQNDRQIAARFDTLASAAFPDTHKIFATEFRARSKMLLGQLAMERNAVYGVTLAGFQSNSRCGSLTKVRIDIARRAMAGCIASLHEVSRYLGRSSSALYQLLTQYQENLNI